MFSGVAEDRQKEILSDMLSNVFKSLKMLSTRIVNFGWRLLYFCYLSDEAFEHSYSLPVSMKMFPANVEDPVVRADILVQTIRDLTVDHTDGPAGRTWGTLIQEIEKNHKMMSRIELLRKAGKNLYEIIICLPSGLNCNLGFHCLSKKTHFFRRSRVHKLIWLSFYLHGFLNDLDNFFFLAFVSPTVLVASFIHEAP